MKFIDLYYERAIIPSKPYSIVKLDPKSKTFRNRFHFEVLCFFHLLRRDFPKFSAIWNIHEEDKMVKHRWLFFTTSLLILSGFIFLSCSQTHSIVEKNILGAGGEENLSKVKNYSFKYGQTTYYVSTEGAMKLTEGREPIITEVILVNKDQAKRNCFNSITELTGLQKSTNQCLAQLRAGLFTLTHFQDKLKFHGLKNFGPQELYMLSTNVNDLQVEFYLDSEKYTLKRDT